MIRRLAGAIGILMPLVGILLSETSLASTEGSFYQGKKKAEFSVTRTVKRTWWKIERWFDPKEDPGDIEKDFPVQDAIRTQLAHSIQAKETDLFLAIRKRYIEFAESIESEN